VGQEAPGASAPYDVEDGVEDGVRHGAPGRFGTREMGLYVRALGIGEVGLVCTLSHAQYSTERVTQNPFSDSFKAEFSEVRATPHRSGTSSLRAAPYPAIQLLQDRVAVLVSLLIIAYLP
jgi:hypothetical protein